MKDITASPIEWAYLAGIIDGEGCVDAVETLPRTKRNVSPNFRIRLHVTNTSAHLISWISERFGGYVVVKARPGQHKATKTCWNVKWTGGYAELILKGCLPYLIVKKYQAELAFKLRGMVHAYDPRVRRLGNRSRLPESAILERREVIQALKDAKKVA